MEKLVVKLLMQNQKEKQHNNGIIRRKNKHKTA